MTPQWMRTNEADIDMVPIIINGAIGYCPSGYKIVWITLKNGDRGFRRRWPSGLLHDVQTVRRGDGELLFMSIRAFIFYVYFSSWISDE